MVVATDGEGLDEQDTERKEVVLAVVLAMAGLAYHEGYRSSGLAYKQNHSECAAVEKLEDDVVGRGSWCGEHCSWTTAENHFAVEGYAGGGEMQRHWLSVGRQMAHEFAYVDSQADPVDEEGARKAHVSVVPLEAAFQHRRHRRRPGHACR